LGNPEKFLVTDAKTDNIALLTSLAADFPGLVARTIPQIYNWGQAQTVRELGFESLIFTTYRSYYEHSVIVQEAINNGIFAVTITSTEVGELSMELSQAGIPTYVHTVNDLIWYSRIRDWGVSNIYTDHLKATLEGF
jgi:glycerophosphoryl diester phosphodiesterase